MSEVCSREVGGMRKRRKRLLSEEERRVCRARLAMFNPVVLSGGIQAGRSSLSDPAIETPTLKAIPEGDSRPRSRRPAVDDTGKNDAGGGTE